MVSYAINRLAQAVVTLVAVSLIVFLLARASGDTAELMAPPDASDADIARISKHLGLDRPLYVQYAKYLGDLLRGDFSDSFSYRAPVADLIRQSLPNTLKLGLSAYLFATVFGIAIGSASALRPGGLLDQFGKGVALLGQSVPSFWLGMILILLFAVRLGWLPAFGSGGPKYLVLPAVTLGWYPLAAVSRLTRSSMLEVLRADHVVFLRSKGVGSITLAKHLLRNAALPLITLSGIQLGALIAGTIVVETLFAYPGMGQLVIQATQSRDYNIVQGVALVATAVFVFLNLLVDLSYGLLDPRVRRAAQ